MKINKSKEVEREENEENKKQDTNEDSPKQEVNDGGEDEGEETSNEDDSDYNEEGGDIEEDEGTEDINEAKKPKPETKLDTEFHLVTDSTRLSSELSVASELNTEATIQLKKEGLIMQLMDKANVCLTKIFIKKVFFKEYKLMNESSINVNLEMLVRLLKKLDTEEIHYLKDTNALILGKLEGEHFKIPLLQDLPNNNIDVSKIKPEIKINVSGYSLKEAVNKAKLVSDCVRLALNIKGLMLETPDEEEIHYSKTVKNEDKINLTNINGNETTVQSKYSIEYLTKILKNQHEISIGLGNNTPLILESNNRLTETLTILAPRIDSD
jgi:hypothetical protein